MPIASSAVFARRLRTLLASPLDKPNTVLILDKDSPVRLSHHIRPA